MIVKISKSLSRYLHKASDSSIDYVNTELMPSNPENRNVAWTALLWEQKALKLVTNIISAARDKIVGKFPPLRKLQFVEIFEQISWR
jgi:hypothetical protein